MQTMDELVSVIVPVYNVEKYVQQCIDSITGQTYQNLEIILVDDGSTDSSGEICDKSAEKDSRIRVLHKENGGLSDARNVGIVISKGRYITFVDSDDYIKTDYIMYLYNILTENQADISTCANIIVEEDGTEISREKNSAMMRSFSNLQAMELLFYQKQFENSAWGKMYKKELFEEIRYPVGKLYEDLGTTYKVFFQSRKIVSSSGKKYFYRQRKNSIMSQAFSRRNMDRIELSEEILDFTEKNASEIRNAAISRAFVSNVQVLRELPLHDKQYQNCYREVRENIKKYRKEVLFDSKAKTINRFIAMTSYLPDVLFQQLGKIYKKIYK